MKKCQVCGNTVDRGKNFCKYCGAPLKNQENKSFLGARFKENEKQYVCMYCRRVHKTFSCVCPDCGKEQIGAVRSKFVIDLLRQLHEVDYPKKEGSIFSKKNTNRNESNSQTPEVQKVNIIKKFVIPDSKEDILDFMNQATKEIDIGVLMADSERELGMDRREFFKQRSYSAVWYEKLGEVYRHATTLYGEDEDFYVIKKIYDNVESKVQQIADSKRKKREGYTYKQRSKRKNYNPTKGIVAIAFVAVLIGIIGQYLTGDDSVLNTKASYMTDYKIEENKDGNIAYTDELLSDKPSENTSNNQEVVKEDEFRRIKENVVNRPIVEGRDYLVKTGVIATYINIANHEGINDSVFNKKDDELTKAGWTIDSVDLFDSSERTLICYVDCKENTVSVADNSSESNGTEAAAKGVTYTFTDMEAIKYASSEVRVRNLPNTSGERLGTLNKNDMVTVTGRCNETGWYRINYDNTIGFVSDAYLIDNRIVTQTVAANVEKSQTKQSDAGPANVKQEDTKSNVEVTSTDTTRGGMVWVTEKGKKYHSNSSCSGMKNPFQITESEAISRNYGRCSKCKW